MSKLTRGFMLVVVAATALSAQSGGRAFQPEDWYKIARVGGGTLSPDGNTLAFTVTTVLEDKNARHTEVWIQPISGGPSPYVLASGSARHDGRSALTRLQDAVATTERGSRSVASTL